MCAYSFGDSISQYAPRTIKSNREEDVYRDDADRTCGTQSVVMPCWRGMRIRAHDQAGAKACLNNVRHLLKLNVNEQHVIAVAAGGNTNIENKISKCIGKEMMRPAKVRFEAIGIKAYYSAFGSNVRKRNDFSGKVTIWYSRKLA